MKLMNNKREMWQFRGNLISDNRNFPTVVPFMFFIRFMSSCQNFPSPYACR
jgi:hypothetical protein